jgi:uncharacterized protein YceK
MAASKTGIIIIAGVLVSGCAARIEAEWPRPSKPSSANVTPYQLSEDDKKFCRSDPRGYDLCRKFLINRARQAQSNRWINRTWETWPEK